MLSDPTAVIRLQCFCRKYIRCIDVSCIPSDRLLLSCFLGEIAKCYSNFRSPFWAVWIPYLLSPCSHVRPKWEVQRLKAEYGGLLTEVKPIEGCRLTPIDCNGRRRIFSRKNIVSSLAGLVWNWVSKSFENLLSYSCWVCAGQVIVCLFHIMVKLWFFLGVKGFAEWSGKQVSKQRYLHFSRIPSLSLWGCALEDPSLWVCSCLKKVVGQFQFHWN